MSPALDIDSQIDLEVKGPMLEDLLSLVSIKKEHARDALDYVAEQAELNAMRKKKGNGSRPDVHFFCLGDSTRSIIQMVENHSPQNHIDQY